jgi:iron(III) transport system ATP-binding protein
VAEVELKALTKRFGDHAAVDAVDLKIAEGEMVALLGPSGCGKTTTLRLIAGFLEPDGGEIVVGGKVLSAPGRTLAPERRNMSMIFQSYALWPHMTVRRNVAYGLEVRKLPAEEIARRVDEILKTARIGDLAERYPTELSGGQQQRVALARALIVEPETLLLDEPLSNLDANLREEMRYELRRFHDAFGSTTVYVTHDQADAMTTADRIVVMKGGRIEQAGTPFEIYDAPVSEFVARFVGGTNILRGPVLDASTISIGGRPIRCGVGALAKGREGILSIRPRDVALEPDAGDQRLEAKILRQIYMGASRDYLVEIAPGIEIKALTHPGIDLAVGSRVEIGLPVRACRGLVG